MHVDIAAKVVTRDDKKPGSVSRAVIDPQTKELIDLVIRLDRGLLEARDVLVPLQAVARAVEGEVRLTLSAEELERQPDFLEMDYVPVPPSWFRPLPYPPGGLLWPAGFAATTFLENEQQNVPPGAVAVSEGTSVDCPDGHIGVIDEVVSDPRGKHLLGFVVRRGLIVTHDTFVPMSWVAEVTPERVALNRTKAEVEHLTEREAS